MLGTQKGIIIIIAYSGISEISQFQIFSLVTVMYHGKIWKVPTNYTFRSFLLGSGRKFLNQFMCLYFWGSENMIMLRKDRDRETMGGGKCLPISSSSKAHFSFPGTCSLGIVICMLQSQFPHSLSASIFFLLLPPFSSFPFPPHFLFSCSFPTLLLPFFTFKSLDPCSLSGTMPFSSQFSQVSLHSGIIQTDVNFSAFYSL